MLWPRIEPITPRGRHVVKKLACRSLPYTHWVYYQTFLHTISPCRTAQHRYVIKYNDLLWAKHKLKLYQKHNQSNVYNFGCKWHIWQFINVNLYQCMCNNGATKRTPKPVRKPATRGTKSVLWPKRPKTGSQIEHIVDSFHQQRCQLMLRPFYTRNFILVQNLWCWQVA